MGTVVRFAVGGRSAPKEAPAGRECEIVIFPGVRIERHDVDLGARLVDSAGRCDFDVPGLRRPSA